ncbi:hypothetical protein GCM10011511_55040 [Puia dinghuensis]|uniref:Carrier domain-containing protein n=2 Tax=Puia dinghuensis TaxID=1792502 RepID=A0A8J2UIU9_9BACT|nr:hypothetical protein GCM10011511_55040 [Puia dinghuensis]
MTYEELMQKVDTFAATLRNKGIGSGDRVAIVLPRSFEMIVAILGVMAAEATFVPIDPDNPTSRIETILQDCQASLILREFDEEFLTTELKAPPSAYIIYTSGSTGKPKGVEVSHSALENYVHWAITELPFTGIGVPLFTSISFDHALTNIFPPLLSGDKIIVLPPIAGGRSLASNLLSSITNDGPYSYVKITPSLFGFLDRDQRAQLGCHTKLLIFGGEKLSPGLISDARRDNEDLAILNHYGPTEATVGCCVYKIPKQFANSIVPIGQPIAHVNTSIRRPDLSIANPLEDGELFISGSGLANGYWLRPDLTQKGFLNLNDYTFGDSIWYRTGDLACVNSEGNIELRGRIDNQIKILGNRIEPEEIIFHLNRFPDVKSSTIFCHKQTRHDELIAVVSYTDRKPNAEEIKRYLQDFLPSVMIPIRYLILEEIPITASGKIDLPRLSSMLAELENDLSIEESVLNKFREILGQENIGPEDDYFLLGGHSLGTVEIAAWAADHYAIDLDMGSLFDYPTAGSLSKQIHILINVKL